MDQVGACEYVEALSVLTSSARAVVPPTMPRITMTRPKR